MQHSEGCLIFCTQQREDGRNLVPFGMRNTHQIGIRISADEGRRWGPIRVLIDLPSWKGLVFDYPRLLILSFNARGSFEIRGD